MIWGRVGVGCSSPGSGSAVWEDLHLHLHLQGMMGCMGRGLQGPGSSLWSFGFWNLSMLICRLAALAWPHVCYAGS